MPLTDAAFPHWISMLILCRRNSALFTPRHLFNPATDVRAESQIDTRVTPFKSPWKDFPWHYLSSGPTQEKKELHHRSQCEKLIQTQPFKRAFLMRLKTDTAMANRKKWRFSFCSIFYDFFLASHNSRKIIVRSVFHELSFGVTPVSIRFSTPKIISCKSYWFIINYYFYYYLYY